MTPAKAQVSDDGYPVEWMCSERPRRTQKRCPGSEQATGQTRQVHWEETARNEGMESCPKH